MIPSFKPGIMSSNQIRVAVGGGADVTPNAVNWSAIGYNGNSGNFAYSERQITGINTTITLQVQIPVLYTGSGVYYLVSNTAGAIVSGDAESASEPFFVATQITNNGTFTVNNNQYVTFGAYTGCFDTSFSITVVNQSDSNTTLDTIPFYYAGEC